MMAGFGGLSVQNEGEGVMGGEHFVVSVVYQHFVYSLV